MDFEKSDVDFEKSEVDFAGGQLVRSVPLKRPKAAEKNQQCLKLP